MISIQEPVNAQCETELIYQYNDKSVIFYSNVSFNKEDIRRLGKGNFQVLNDYIEYRNNQNPNFKEELFNIYADCRAYLDRIELAKEFNPSDFLESGKCTALVNNILDLLDLDKAIEYVRYCNTLDELQPNRIKTPLLPTEWNPDIEKNGEGSREQTFLVDDYLQLIAFILLMKAIFLPITHFAYLKEDCIKLYSVEYYIVGFLDWHNIVNSYIYTKLVQWITKILDRESIAKNGVTTEDFHNVKVLDKNIATDEMVRYILGGVIFSQFHKYYITDDTSDKHLVNKIYKAIRSKSGSDDIYKYSVREKRQLNTADVNKDEDSLAESYVSIANLPNGVVIEINYTLDSVDKVIQQFNSVMRTQIPYDHILDMGIRASRLYYNNIPIEDSKIAILAMIFKTITDPRNIFYIELSGMINLLAVGFSYLWHIGHRELAIFLLSRSDPDVSKEDTVYMGSLLNYNVPPVILELFYLYFPLFTYKSSSKKGNIKINVMETKLKELAYSIQSQIWIPLVDQDTVYEVYGNNNFARYDIVKLLMDFAVRNEQNYKYDHLQHVD